MLIQFYLITYFFFLFFFIACSNLQLMYLSLHVTTSVNSCMERCSASVTMVEALNIFLQCKLEWLLLFLVVMGPTSSNPTNHVSIGCTLELIKQFHVAELINAKHSILSKRRKNIGDTQK